MSLRRRVAIALLRAALVVSLLATAVILHVPGPSGVSASAEADVRRAWVGVGEAARAGAAHLPDLPDALAPLASDKTIHFALFVALAFFWASARALDRRLDVRGALLVFGALALYAGVGEAAQAFEGRIADPLDWVANLLGAAVGTLGVMLVHRAVRRLRRRGASPVTVAAATDDR